ncbi:hypothetical protein Taro_032496 [Colocasia esculenta]|uniref:Uncharacterized protein n=1 Tax=Colocasia esculenta TaxID=4460 RepID=A0A843VST2_COLES|nr:hypothetical protein [Colocasia esculenta]
MGEGALSWIEALRTAPTKKTKNKNLIPLEFGRSTLNTWILVDFPPESDPWPSIRSKADPGDSTFHELEASPPPQLGCQLEGEGPSSWVQPEAPPSVGGAIQRGGKRSRQDRHRDSDGLPVAF